MYIVNVYTPDNKRYFGGELKLSSIRLNSLKRLFNQI